MAQTLTGTTLSGSTSGSVTGIQSCTIGGMDINVINWASAGDTNAVTNNLPGTNTEGPMTLTIVYVKAIADTLRTTALSRATETWTYTLPGTSSVYGTGYVSSVSTIDSDPDSEDTFQLVITPSSVWTYAIV